MEYLQVRTYSIGTIVPSSPIMVDFNLQHCVHVSILHVTYIHNFTFLYVQLTFVYISFSPKSSIYFLNSTIVAD